jgi:hypothetical protein
MGGSTRHQAPTISLNHAADGRFGGPTVAWLREPIPPRSGVDLVSVDVLGVEAGHRGDAFA